MNTFRLQVPEKAKPVFDRGYRYYGLHGGRGGTKSHVFGTKAIVRMLEQRFRIICAREIQRSIADSVHHLLCKKIEDSGYRSWFDITDTYIRGPNESLAMFRGLQNHTVDAVKSTEDVDALWLEEGQAVSQRSLDLAIPTIRAPGSEIWCSWNPEFDTDPVDKLLRGNGPMPEALVIEIGWRDNPWFPEVLKVDMERDKRRDPDKYAWVWEGAYKTASEARIFRNFRSGDVDVPDNVVWFYGVDWGFSVDPLAAVRFCFPDPQTLYVSDEVYEVGVPTERVPIVLSALPGLDKWPSAADSARPETIDYVRRHGFPRLRPAMKGQGSIEDGITFLQSFDIVVSERCPNVLNEFRRYAYKTDKQTGEILPVAEDAWNHAIDALRYGAERLHRKGKVIPTAIPKVRTAPRDYGPHPEDDVDSWKVA